MELRKLDKERLTSRRKSLTDINSTSLFGKLPPQARDLEEAVLGAVMLDKSAVDVAFEQLKPECFYVDAHQKIFAAMQALQQKNFPIDMLTVVEELKAQGNLELVGGAFYITKLTNAVVSSAHIEIHSRIVLQKFIQRELIRISNETIADAYEDSADAFDLLDQSETRLFEIGNDYLRNETEDIGTVLVETIKRIDELRDKQDEITGIPTGFPELDNITYGWQPGDLIILAARPSVGKTALSLNLARNAALNRQKPTPVAVFSLEMSSNQLVQRILSAESEVPLEKIARGNLEDRDMERLHKKGISVLSDAPIHIDDTPALNVFELRAKCRRLVNKFGVKMIIIDYLQLMSGTGGNKNANREQEISRISRDLKTLAKELKIPIIALSQLSREVEKRKDKNFVPQLSDLRESGAIEQDADIVMFLYRPEYNDINQDENGESTYGKSFLKIAKHRNGRLATIELTAELETQRFLPFQNNNTRVFIQKGSKMNNQDYGSFDDDGEVPFK